jgi:hypothetical protein
MIVSCVAGGGLALAVWRDSSATDCETASGDQASHPREHHYTMTIHVAAASCRWLSLRLEAAVAAAGVTARLPVAS